MKTLLLFLLALSLQPSLSTSMAWAQEDTADLQIDSERGLADSQAELNEAKSAKEMALREAQRRMDERSRLQETIAKAKATEARAHHQRQQADKEIAASKQLGVRYQKAIKAAEQRQLAAEKDIQQSQQKVSLAHQQRDQILDQKNQVEQKTKDVLMQAKDAHAQALEAQENAKLAVRELNQAIAQEKQSRADLAREKIRSQQQIALANARAAQAKKNLQNLQSSSKQAHR